MNPNVLVSIAAIVNNDESIIEAYIDETVRIISSEYENFELVLVDNGSTDNSVFKIKTALNRLNNVRLIVLSKRYQDEVANTAALESCIGDFVVLMDLNTDPPDLIPVLLEQAYNGNDIIVASWSNKEEEPFLYRVLKRLFFAIIGLFIGSNLNVKSSSYVCFSRKIVNFIIQIKDRNRYLKFLKLETGFPRSVILYDKINRSDKKRREDFLKKIYLGIEISISNSNRLIKIASVTSFFAGFINLLYIIYIIIIKIFKAEVAEGWTSTNLINSLMFSLMFIVLSILAEYIAYISEEIKKGHLYQISEEANSSVLFGNREKKNVV